MSFIFIDESGDLGNKSASSKYFVMTAIKIDDSRKLERVVNKIRKTSKNEIGCMNELKGFNLPNEIIKKIFKNLNKLDYETFIVVFDKASRYKDKTKNKDDEIIRFDNIFTVNLNNYKNYSVRLNHVNSVNFKGLQIADIISWSVFQSVENENDEFVNLIKNKTIIKVF